MMAGFKDRLDTVEETSGDSKKKKVLSTVKGRERWDKWEVNCGVWGIELWGSMTSKKSAERQHSLLAKWRDVAASAESCHYDFLPASSVPSNNESK